MDPDDRAALAERAARAGGAVAIEGYRADLDVTTKAGKTDVVTRYDHDAQARVAAVLADTDEPLVGEESGTLDTVPDDGPAWIVDPIDGTNNFVRGLPTWGTAVACVVDGEPVAAAVCLPVLDDCYVAGDGPTTRNGVPVAVSDETDPEACTVVPTYWWDWDEREQYAAACRATVERFGDLRRFGSMQASLGALAAGGVDGVFTDLRPNPWDSIAGAHLVRRAGGTVTDLAGERWRHDGDGFVASSGAVHDAVLEAARAAAAAARE